MLYASSYLNKEGIATSLFACGAQGEAGSAKEALDGASAVILPIPATRDGVNLNAPNRADPLPLADLSDIIGADIPVFVGKPNAGALKIFGSRGIVCRDYAAQPFYAETNAAYTVEGALALAAGKYPKAICECRVSVLGAGNIGKRLSGALKALGAKVTLFSRSERDRAYTRYLGMNDCGYGDAAAVLPFCDMIFNTVPDGEIAACLAYAGKNSLVVDLAGVVCECDNVIKALALPSKYSPQSAGELIARTVIGMGGFV